MKNLRLLVLAVPAILAASVVLALPPLEDPLETIPGDRPGGTVVRVGTPSSPPLPAGFFGPGSDPFVGTIDLKGYPLDGTSFGTASTLMLRSDDPLSPLDPVGESDTIDIEIVALSLVSIQPVVVTYGGTDPEDWDVEVSPSVLPPPLGTLSALKTHPNGGTFETTFFVLPRLEFTRVSDGMTVVWDTGLEGILPLQLQGFDGRWVHSVDPALGILAPSDGYFVPCVEELIPGDPATQCPTPLHAVEAVGAMDLTPKPAVSIPVEDPWVSVPGPVPGGTWLDFGWGNLPAVPADFFAPGSDPFDGQVALEGEPLGPPWGDFRDSDTLVRRAGDPFDRCELPSPDLRTIDIEIIELNLKSVSPITVTYGGIAPEPWDVYVDAPPPDQPPGLGDDGVLVAAKTHANGGTFQSVLHVQPIFIFVRVADGQVEVLDSDAHGWPRLTFDGVDGHWVHTVDPGLHLLAPSDGRFVPGVQEMVPGVPSSQVVRVLNGIEVSGAGEHTLRPSADPLTDAPVVRPGGTMMLRAYPNPFGPSTTIRYGLPAPGRLSLVIYDVGGKRVRTLRDGFVAERTGSAVWDGRDGRGRPVAAGVYFYAARASEERKVGKVVLVR